VANPRQRGARNAAPDHRPRAGYAGAIAAGRLAKLLRFASTHADEGVSFAAYVARMKGGQSAIYYVTADSVDAARNSPQLEIFRKKGIEVLLLADRVDEWVMGGVTEFDGRKLKDVARGDLELGGLSDAADKQREEAALKDSKSLLKRFKDALGEKVREVRPSLRLKDSPAVLVRSDADLSAQLRRVLEASGQSVPAGVPLLELNVEHPLVRYLDGLTDAGQFSELAQLLFDEAQLLEEGQLADAADFSRRLNRLLARLAGVTAP